MKSNIRRFGSSDMAAVVELSLLAWEPVFAAWEQILGPTLYPIAIYADWRKSQKEAVEKACSNERCSTWVAEVRENIVGFDMSCVASEGKSTCLPCILRIRTPGLERD